MKNLEWLIENQKEFCQQVIDYYPLALEVLSQDFFYSCTLHYRIKQEIGKNITSVIPLSKQSKDTIARFHAIETIALEGLSTKRDQQLSYLMNNKKLELLNLMIEQGFLDEQWENVNYFTVSFKYKPVFTLIGKDVRDIHQILSFARTISALRDKRLPVASINVFGFFISDACRLWYHAILSRHPNLEIWRSAVSVILPINPDTWLTRMPRWWIRVPNRLKKVMEKLKTTDPEMLAVIRQEGMKNVEQFVELEKQGLTEEEIRENHAPKFEEPLA